MDDNQYCTKCGNGLSTEDMFCRRCGKSTDFTQAKSRKKELDINSHGEADDTILDRKIDDMSARALFTEARILTENHKYKKALTLLDGTLKLEDLRNKLTREDYIGLLMLYRQLNFLEGHDHVARTTEGEIINTLFQREVEMQEYSSLEPKLSYNPKKAELILREIISTYPHKNSFYFAKKYSENTSEPENTAASSFRQSGRKRTRGLKVASIISAAVLASLILYVGIFLRDDVIISLHWSDASEDIQRITLNSGFSKKGMAAFLSTEPELVSADQLKSACQPANSEVLEYGCYLADQKKIYILKAPKGYQGIEYATAAHETLHAVWFGLGALEREALSNKLLALYSDKNSSDYASLQEDLAVYPKDSQLLATELYAFVGSEYPSLLPDDYSQHFSDRNIPSSAQDSFDSSIRLRTEGLEKRKAQLEASLADINTYHNNFVANYERGYVYRSAYNYGIYQQNYAAYKSRFDRWEEDRVRLNFEIEEHKNLLKGFFPSDASIQSL